MGAPGIVVRRFATLLGARVLVALAVVLVALVAARVGLPGGRTAPTRTEDRSTSRADDRAAALVRRHHCWTGPAPASVRGRIPGHAVVTRPDGTTVWTADVGPALEAVFGTPAAGAPHLRVRAFCR